MKISKYYTIYTIIVALAVSLLTGLVNTTPNLVGATWYGFPFAWLIKMAIAPQYSPWALQGLNLLFDVIFWFIVTFAVEFAITYLTRHKTAGYNKK